ncbi:trypsin-like peptidase domain-containing protein [Lamprocystis purpurea]|jgi:hypothetical protein|uniref:trypsin-like peptidase domain-containing protein n=1 Tax=Lamprocystis purpurea TaxID=61598 RepID=UPI00037D3FFB|nr:trypsin-like peptidase domain-containing protein [Lamprocystis purpurea]MBV5348027.1 trypsin-like peptidase domain-containing protein [bacterium]
MPLPDTAVDPGLAALRAACVRVMGARPGCGFPPAPGWLVTCAHVVGRDTALGSLIACVPWQGAPRAAVLRHLDGDLDLALLHDPDGPAPALRLGAPPDPGADLIGIGYPVRDDQPEFDQITGHYEGETSRQPAAGGTRTMLKFKDSQIEPGFSGGPLFAPGRGTVIGVIRWSRDVRTALGGWAIPTHDLIDCCAAAGVPIAPSGPAAPPVGNLPARLRDLLLALPGWSQTRRRRQFITLALWQQPILNRIDLDGTPTDVAADLAVACLEQGGPDADGYTPLLALLAAVPSEFGPQAARDQVIAEILSAATRP